MLDNSLLHSGPNILIIIVILGYSINRAQFRIHYRQQFRQQRASLRRHRRLRKPARDCFPLPAQFHQSLQSRDHEILLINHAVTSSKFAALSGINRRFILKEYFPLISSDTRINTHFGHHKYGASKESNCPNSSSARCAGLRPEISDFPAAVPTFEPLCVTKVVFSGREPSCPEKCLAWSFPVHLEVILRKAAKFRGIPNARQHQSRAFWHGVASTHLLRVPGESI